MWVKNLVKHFIFLPNRMYREYLARWPFSRNTRELDNWRDFSTSSHVLHTWPFRGLLFSRASDELVANYTDSSLKLDSLPISHTHPLQINTHKHREIIEEITIKFGMELKPTKASWKS